MKKIMIFLMMCGSVFATVDDGESIRQYFSGTLTEFTFTQKVNSADDILVFTKLISTGVETPLIEDADYTIVPNGSGYLFGGTVTYPTVSSGDPAIGSTFQVVIVRSIKKSQETSQGAITPTSVVASLDKLTRIVQDLQDRVDRSWRLPQSDATTFDVEMPTLADRAETFPFFDASGVLTYVSSVIADSIGASPFGVSLVQAANAAAGRNVMVMGTTDAVEFAGITGTTGAFSGDITLGAGASLRGGATSGIVINTNKFVVATNGTGNTTIAGTLDVTGVMTTTAASVLGDGSTIAAATESGDSARTIADKAYADTKEAAIITQATAGLANGWNPFSKDGVTPLAVDVIYQAECDGFITVRSHTVSGAYEFNIATDVNNPPATIRMHTQDTAGIGSLMCYVKKDHFVRVNLDTGSSIIIYWMAFGTGDLVVP